MEMHVVVIVSIEPELKIIKIIILDNTGRENITLICSEISN